MKKSMIIAIAAAMLTAGTTVCHAQTQQKTTQQKTQTAQTQEPVYEQDKSAIEREQNDACNSSAEREQDKVDKRAEFTGGMEKLLQFMMQNVKYPKEAEQAGASGTVRVHFIVEKDGTLTDVRVPDSIHPALDAEAIRLVKAMPKWQPAQLKGKPVRSKAMLAIPFRLK